MKSLITVLTLLFVTSITYANSSQDKEDARLKHLDNICNEARIELLKPVIASKVEDCVNKKNKDRDYCERYYSDYGWGNVTGYGRHRNARLFDQIPECIEAFDARKNRNR